MRLLDAALVASLAHGAEVFDGNFKHWCEINKVPRSTAYRHRKRVLELGRWEPLSRRPHRTAEHATPVEVEEAIVRWRLELNAEPGHGSGADTIRYWLQEEAAADRWADRGWVVPSRATIHKIVVRRGLVVPEPKKRPKSSYRRFCYARPRDCYQIDATKVRLTNGNLVVVFEVLDDCSRVLVATLAAPSETAAGAVAAIQRAFDTYGVPALVLSDNGAAFTAQRTQRAVSRFERLVTSTGARLIHSSPYHPQTCGKVERHHRTFKTWLAAQPTPATLTDLQVLCDRYQLWYNTARRHSAVNQAPQQAWAAAPGLGGPGELPVQDDAHVRVVVTTDTGNFTVGPVIIGLTRRHASTRVTVLRDHNHITVYQADGTPIGHLRVDFTLKYQRIRPAA